MTKDQIIEKIKDKTSLSDDEIAKKIKTKLEQLAGLISEDGAAHIIANELGVDLNQQAEGSIEIKHLLEGMRNVELTVQVQKKFDSKEFNSARGPGKLASFMVADKTGKLRATLWNTKVDELYPKFQEGDTINLKNAYIRKNNYTGNIDINLGDGAEIEIVPESEKLDIDNSPDRKKIIDLTPQDVNTEVLATLVQVSDIRFWEACPKCGKKPKLENEEHICQEHGKIAEKDLDYSYVLNTYIDDGSASIRTVFWKKQIQKLLDEPHETILSYRETPENFEKFKSSLLGDIIKVRGRVNKNEAFDRMEFVAFDLDKNPNPEEEIKYIEKPKSEASTTGETVKTETVIDNSETDSPAVTPEKKDVVKETVSLDDIEEINIDDD